MSATTTVSPARLAANRANAQRSTGPRTEAGKARSRANAVKHGLTGAGVALPGEDAERIEAEFLQVQEELAPTTLLGMKLARRLALLTVRQERAVRFGAARLRALGRAAGAEFDAARVRAADDLVATIEEGPRTARRQLLATPEGVDRLVDELLMLHTDLSGTPPVWSAAHHRRLDALFGFRAGDLPFIRPTRYSLAVLGQVATIDPAEYLDLAEGAERLVWAQVRVLEVIEAEVERLESHRATLDHAAIEEGRADALDLAAFDLDPDALLAARYEATAARELSRTLRDFHLAEALAPPAPPAEAEAPAAAELEPHPIPGAAAAPAPPPEAAPNPLPVNDLPAALGSFGAGAPATSTAPAAAPNPAPAAPTAPRRPVPTVAFTPPRAPQGR